VIERRIFGLCSSRRLAIVVGKIFVGKIFVARKIFSVGKICRRCGHGSLARRTRAGVTRSLARMFTAFQSPNACFLARKSTRAVSDAQCSGTARTQSGRRVAAKAGLELGVRTRRART
jgi:hypothetical protein